MKLTELIAQAPWREAVTYRETWPHEYVLLQKDQQRELLEAVRARFRNGEGVPCRFFAMNNVYLFVGDYKYTTVHECIGPEVADSTEWQAVRDAVTPRWNAEVQPRMQFAAGSPGAYRRIR